MDSKSWLIVLRQYLQLIQTSLFNLVRILNVCAWEASVCVLGPCHQNRCQGAHLIPPGWKGQSLKILDICFWVFFPCHIGHLQFFQVVSHPLALILFFPSLKFSCLLNKMELASVSVALALVNSANCSCYPQINCISSSSACFYPSGTSLMCLDSMSLTSSGSMSLTSSSPLPGQCTTLSKGDIIYPHQHLLSTSQPQFVLAHYSSTTTTLV